MHARRDLSLLLLLSRTPGAGDFGESWRSLLQHHPALAAELDAVQLVGSREDVGSGRLATCLAEVRASVGGVVDGGRVVSIAGGSPGRSLNDALHWACASSAARYWFVWDDRHVCVRPFLGSARRALEADGADLWQLALSSEDFEACEDHVLRDGHALLRPDRAGEEAWPLFTLGPSLHRLGPLRCARALGALEPFLENTSDWYHVVSQFGRGWERAGGVTGLLQPTPAEPSLDDIDADDSD